MTNSDGRTGGRANGGRVDGRTRVCGRADGWAGEREDGRAGGQASVMTVRLVIGLAPHNKRETDIY